MESLSIKIIYINTETTVINTEITNNHFSKKKIFHKSFQRQFMFRISHLE